jgi:hypothetical protein
MAFSTRKKPISVSSDDRPFTFPSLKVDGELWTEKVVVENRGQGILAAQQEAAKIIRQRRAAMAVDEVSVEKVEPVITPTSAPSQEAQPSLPPRQLDQWIRAWLEENLPSSEQLFQAAASLVSLQGIENRVRDLVVNFKDDLDAFKSGFTSWFDGIQKEWAVMVAGAGELQAEWRQQLVELTSWRSKFEAELREFVKTLRGPQGKVGPEGMAGSAVTIVDRLPKGRGVDFTIPYLKRPAIVGDCLIDGSTDMRYAWRWDGQSWERGPAMVSLQVRDVKVASVMGAPQYTTQVIQKTGGGGSGGGGEALTANRLILNSPSPITDSSNWAGIADPTSGVLELEIRALDGSYVGQSAVCIASFAWDTGGDKWQEFALNGSLANVFNIDLSIRRSAAVAPTAFTGVFPTTASRLVINAQPVLVPGASAGGTTRFALAGSVEYNRESDTKIYLPTDKIPEPLWHWG